MDENKTQSNDENIKVLRTYTSDMADAIRTNEASVIKIALAEKEKKEKEEIFQKAEGTPLSKTFLVIGGIILIALAIFASYFLLQKKKELDTPSVVIKDEETFISYDSFKNVDVTNVKNIDDFIGILNQQIFEKSGLLNVFFLKKIVGEQKQEITSENFLSLIKAEAPGSLVRSLSGKFLLGKYQTPVDSGTFIIFDTDNYNQAYASMLSWEKNLLKDLFPIFGITITQGVEGEENLLEKEWKDIIINNRDARVLYGREGQGVLYYLFVNKNYLLITNNVNALKEITTRLLMKDALPR